MKATLTQNNSKFDKVPILLFALVGTFTKRHVAPQNCLKSKGMRNWRFQDEFHPLYRAL